jgi:hypothetical protein
VSMCNCHGGCKDGTGRGCRGTPPGGALSSAMQSVALRMAKPRLRWVAGMWWPVDLTPLPFPPIVMRD